MLDLDFNNRWNSFMKSRSEEIGDDLDLQAILFMVGIQELGFGFRKYSKDDKINVIHVAVCTLLEPFGYYSFSHRDEKGWPHFNFDKTLPPLKSNEQERLIKEALMEYFIEE